jgi:thymidylate synthase (FAD)
MKATYENHYLSDHDVANFARQSFDKLADNFTKDQNDKLIRFLARGMQSGDWEKLIQQMKDHGKVDYAAPVGSLMEKKNDQELHDLAVYMRSIPCHWVPFGHPQITLRMQAPIPIRVQCFKHKIGFVESEESRRYISSTPQVFVPPFFRAKAANVKQGSGDQHEYSDYWLNAYKSQTEGAVWMYEQMVNNGICPEQARFVLPQGCEVNWVWTGSLYAFANFYNQRSDSHAQKEIQELAEQVNQIIAPLFPVSWAALTQGAY